MSDSIDFDLLVAVQPLPGCDDVVDPGMVDAAEGHYTAASVADSLLNEAIHRRGPLFAAWPIYVERIA